MTETTIWERLPGSDQERIRSILRLLSLPGDRSRTKPPSVFTRVTVHDAPSPPSFPARCRVCKVLAACSADRMPSKETLRFFNSPAWAGRRYLGRRWTRLFLFGRVLSRTILRDVAEIIDPVFNCTERINLQRQQPQQPQKSISPSRTIRRGRALPSPPRSPLCGPHRRSCP